MIKHWEILENKWTQNSAYVLGIQGEDQDVSLILQELSSFCSLTDVKVNNFTHIFELPNVSDDDILQKIRTKIEEAVRRSSLNNKDKGLSSVPLQVSSGTLDFVSEGESYANILGPSNSSGGESGNFSSDGNEINLNGNDPLHLQDTKTEQINSLEQDIVQVEKLVEEKPSAQVNAENKPQEPKEEAKQSPKEEPKKEEKVGFFKRLFSFGKKKKSEVKAEPLPIEKVATQEKSAKEKKEEQAMHGVVIKGTAFPSQEVGAKDIKEVSLESKTARDLLEKGAQEGLQAQVPIDDIFAAETICQFYDDQGTGEPKIEKIEEPTPMPTPRVITITQNKILEENLKHQEEIATAGEITDLTEKSEIKKEATAALKEEPANNEAPVADIPAAQVVSKETKEEPSVQEIKTKEVKKEVKSSSKEPAPQAAKKEHKENEPAAKEELKEKEAPKAEAASAMPKLDISEQEISAIKKSAAQEIKAAPKVVKQEKPAQPKQEKSSLPKTKITPAPKAGKEPPAAQSKAPNAPAKPGTALKSANKPQVKPQKTDGFDHTIQTTSIPVYKKSNWPIEMPIVPSFTLENINMSSNRFAHAAAMTIVENPGTIHNPFFVFGEGGCGKTHFLNAIGVEFAKKMSQDKVFITNGVRFSRGVQRAIENGTIDKVKEFLDNAEVLIIDDIHLTAVNEINKEFISKVLNDYVAKRKQLVIASKYPPQGLTRFEELTNFKLSQGWISELKPLRPNHFLKAYVKMAQADQVDLTEAQCRSFFGRDNLTLGMIAKDLKRAKVLHRRIKDSGSITISYEQLLNYITAIAGEDSSSQLESLDLTSPLSIRRGENTNWGNFGFFFPKESADKFKWIVYATMQRAKELGIKGGFNFALKSAYSTEHIISSAFKIANVCDSKNLKAAIILGPDPKEIQPAIRDNFCDILSHMLEVMMIRCAIISYEDIKKPSSYVKVLGDVLK